MNYLPLILALWVSVSAAAMEQLDFEVYVDGTQRVHLHPQSYHPDFFKIYEQLNEEQQQKFLKQREKALIDTSKKYLDGFYEKPDGIYYGSEEVLKWGSHKPGNELIRKAKAHFLLNYLESVDRQLFLNSRVMVEKKEFGINISAMGSLLFWLPKKFLEEANGLPKGGVWSFTLVFAYDKESKGLHLDLSFLKFAPEQIFYLPGAELGAYLYAAVFTGNGYFESSPNGPSLFNVASVVGYERSPQHRSGGILFGHSQPPILSGASTYNLREVKRFDMVRAHVGLVPIFNWVNDRFQRLKNRIQQSACYRLFSGD